MASSASGEGAGGVPPPGAGGGVLSIVGDVVQHVAAGQEATCEFTAVGFTKENIDINILSPSKVPVSYR